MRILNLAGITARKAYSLFEILLVISLLAVIAVITVDHFQKQAEQKKIDTTVKEFQMLLQAATRYCLYNGEFGYRGSFSGWSEAFTEKFRPFFPFDDSWRFVIYNPWGYSYAYRVASEEEDPKKATRTYGLRTQVPTAEIAKQIAARLPFAISSIEAPNNNFVIAYAPMPGQELANKSGPVYKIYSIGQKESNDFNLTVNCPKNWSPGVITGIAGLEPDLKKVNGKMVKFLIWNLNTRVTAISTSSFRIQTSFQGSTISTELPLENMTQHPVLVNYITYCKSL